MDFSEMQKGRFTGQTAQPAASPPAASQVASQATRAPYTPPYQKGEYNAKLTESRLAYTTEAVKYAERFAIDLAPNLETALTQRRQGGKSLTMREVDTAARMQVPLDSEFLIKAMVAIDGMISEGIPGEPDNVYYLRAFYNRGVKFKKPREKSGKSEYDYCDLIRQQKADRVMAEILSKLEQAGLPAWPQEQEQGFPEELCKPEYMTWNQFHKAEFFAKQRFGTGDQSYVVDSFPLTARRPATEDRAATGVSREPGDANPALGPGVAE